MLIPMEALGGSGQGRHLRVLVFTGETEAQRGKVMCPSSHSKARDSDSKPGALAASPC